MMSSVVAVPTASAGPYSWPTVTFLNHATVRAAGAGAIVQVSVACTGLKVSILEVGVHSTRADGSVAGAGGYARLDRDCTSEPQVVSVPLAADNLSLENSDVPGDGGPLRAGRTTAVAYASCLGYNCRSRYYPGQTVTLTNSPDLDRLSDGTTTVRPHLTLRAAGAAADVHLTSRCAHAVTVPAGNIEIHQTNSSPYVQYATNQIDQTIRCTSPIVSYRVRVHPSDHRLHTGKAFIINYGAGSLFGQVDIR